MVKPPRIRHSKSADERVTIDLGKDDVSRISDEKSASEASRTSPASAPANASEPSQSQGKATSLTSAGAASAQAAGNSAASSTAKAGTDATTGQKPSAQSGSSQNPGSKATSGKTGAGGANAGMDKPTPSAFGRDPKVTTPPPASSPSTTSRSNGRSGALLGGLVGGAIVLAAAAGAYYADVLPTSDQPVAEEDERVSALQGELATLRQELSELRTTAAAVQPGETQPALDRIEAMGVLVDETRAQIAELRTTLQAGGGEQPNRQLADRLSAIEQRLAALSESNGGGQLEGEIAALRDSVSGTAQEARSAGAAATDAAEQIAALQKTVSDLSARLEEQAERPGAALAIAASALKAAIDRGQPFTTELETYASVAPDAPEIAPLRDMAEHGVPTRAAIEARAGETAAAMISAVRGNAPDQGLVDRLWSSAQSLVTVRPIGNVEGSDVPAITARMEAALKAGDYAAALAEYDSLPPAAKSAGESLAADIRARQAADQLVGKALADALRA